jgi:hypothetical protein
MLREIREIVNGTISPVRWRDSLSSELQSSVLRKSEPWLAPEEDFLTTEN